MNATVIHWEEDPTRTRVVRGVCKVCAKDWPPLDKQDPYLVSPSGLSHHANFDRTYCGKDATGPDWWWRS